jgi:hypothetical protein
MGLREQESQKAGKRESEEAGIVDREWWLRFCSAHKTVLGEQCEGVR